MRLIVPESSHMLMLTRIVQISEFSPSFHRIKSLSTHQHSLHDAPNHEKIRCEKFRSISLKAFYLINIRCMTHLIAQISDGLNSFRLTRYFFISTPFITSPGSRCSKILNQVHSLPPSEIRREVNFFPRLAPKLEVCNNDDHFLKWPSPRIVAGFSMRRQEPSLYIGKLEH